MKRIADCCRNELGFTPRPQLAEAIRREEAMIALAGGAVVGFAVYRHRIRDTQTTLHIIATDPDHRRRGVATALIYTLVAECILRRRGFIQAKCPAALESNALYKQLEWERVELEEGKKRPLWVWRYQIAAK